MEVNKHGKNNGSAFVWGLIIGALLATLLTTKRGRLILKEIISLGTEMVEDFVAERSANKKPQETEEVTKEAEIPVEPITEKEVEEVVEDLKSDIAEEEMPQEIKFEEVKIEPVKEPETKGNGHKKRLFRGIRRNK